MPDKKLLQRKIAERVIERLIGAAIDINMHIISDLSGDVAEDYFESCRYRSQNALRRPPL